jgi:hypothetical protein
MPLFLVVVGSLMLALCSQWSLKNKESVVWVNNFEASDALPQNPLLLRAISAGFHGFAASVMWTNCIFSYADQILSGKSDAGFARKLNDVVELDTLWQYPYEFAGLTIEGSGRGSHPIGVEILALAARRFPLEGRIHILYSQAIMNASWIDSTKRLDSARKAMLPLMDSRVRAPEYARTLAITMAANIYGDREALRQLFYVMSSERDPMVRYALSRKLHPLLVGVTNFSGDSLQIFEEGISRVFQSGEVGIDKHLNALIDGLQNPVARPKVFNAIASILAQ